MTKIINLLRKCFTQTPNAVIIDQALSDGAVRIFLYMSSKPDDWSFNNADIKKQLGIKRDETIAKYFKELISSGWVSRTAKIKNGRPSGYFDYTIYPEPIIPATTKNADLLKSATTINADTGKPQLPQNSSYSNTEFGNNTKKNNTPPLNDLNKQSKSICEVEAWYQIATNNNFLFTELEKAAIKEFADHISDFKKRHNKSLTTIQVGKYLGQLSKHKSANFDICSIIQDTIMCDYELLVRPTFRHIVTNTLIISTQSIKLKPTRYPCTEYISPQNTHERKTLCGYIDICYRDRIDPRTGLVLTAEQIELLKAHFSQKNRLNISIYEYIYQEEVLKNVSILEQSLNDIPASFVVVESNNSDSQNKDK